MLDGLHVTKTRVPQMTGDEFPPPGKSIFQLKSFSEIVAGKFGPGPGPSRSDRESGSTPGNELRRRDDNRSQ